MLERFTRLLLVLGVVGVVLSDLLVRGKWAVLDLSCGPAILSSYLAGAASLISVVADYP
jgi:hypothetical protein